MAKNKIDEKEVEELKKQVEVLKKQAAEMESKKDTPKETEKYSIGEVPTQFGLSVVNTKTGEPLDINSVLALLLNNQEKILKSLK